MHVGESLLDVAVLVTVRLTPPFDFVFSRQVQIRPRMMIPAIAESVPMSGHFTLSRSGVFGDLLTNVSPMLLRKNFVVLMLIFSSSKCCSMITILY